MTDDFPEFTFKTNSIKKDVEVKIRTLVTELLEAILDPKLKELVKTKTFLTGGCFKALYNNQTVNDWDFYFVSEEAVKEFKSLLDLGNPNPFTNKKVLYMDFKAISQFAISFKFKNYMG